MKMLLANPSRLKQSATIMSCQLADHQGSEIKYFCCSEECMLPLCPECIQNHSEYHERKNKVAILKNFGDIRSLHHKKISNQINAIQSDVEQFEAFLNKDAARETGIIQKLQTYKESLIKALNEVFTELERVFKLQMVQDYTAKSERVDRITREVKIYVNQLKEYEAALENENCTKIIGKIHRRNFAKEYEEIKGRIAKDELQLDQYKLQIDEQLTNKICDDLNRYIGLFKIEEYKGGKQSLSESKSNLKSERPPRVVENKLQSNIFEMAESNIQIRPDAFSKKNQSDLFEEVMSQRISRPTTSQSSNYPEYNCQPETMIKEFFPVENSDKKPKPSIGGDPLRTTGTRNMKGELEGVDAKSQSTITDEYGSDFEQANDEELETIEDDI